MRGDGSAHTGHSRRHGAARGRDKRHGANRTDGIFIARCCTVISHYFRGVSAHDDGKARTAAIPRRDNAGPVLYAPARPYSALDRPRYKPASDNATTIKLRPTAT